MNSDTEHNHGCNGGGMDRTYEYKIQNQGFTTEANYPYETMEEICDMKKASTLATAISEFGYVPSNNEVELLMVVATQPVSVSIDGAGQGQICVVDWWLSTLENLSKH
ncbi:hypothetical protein CIPAW_09G068700 [Carya illinoinensis]|uniref:Peptidase C1A papain C-terminal domain-containing protein n=1 Tax=Carya illinoinensis TaxID=32201 RepID=A0A8T1PEQ6_CARIL|nr:hypothetical protein CIPAW_09G068700 [Carya illinoinensis]